MSHDNTVWVHVSAATGSRLDWWRNRPVAGPSPGVVYEAYEALDTRALVITSLVHPYQGIDVIGYQLIQAFIKYGPIVSQVQYPTYSKSHIKVDHFSHPAMQSTILFFAPEAALKAYRMASRTLTVNVADHSLWKTAMS